jgi:crotonobetainyl-CoA:carnitine CoA-transferase CaiB-like acyl-CoA transferase
MMHLLEGLQILNLAYNAPGPGAARRLQTWGAQVVKVEPPGGDPLSRYCRPWYESLIAGQMVLTLDLKQPDGRMALEGYLAGSDLLITAVRRESLERLGLDWKTLHARHTQLCHVAITGYPEPDAGRPGHDLTFQAEAGLLDPPHMPRCLTADLAASEIAANAGLALLLARALGKEAGCLEMPIAEAAAEFAAPWHFGMNKPFSRVGGAFAGYRLYPASDGWIAVGALEEIFWQRLYQELGFHFPPSAEELGEVFMTRRAQDWQAWAAERNLPVTLVA